MPRVYKSGKKFQGNKNSGRKTIKQEVEEAKELITQEALIALANSKVYKQLKKIEEESDSFIKTKEMALPITLRGIVEKKLFGGDKENPIIVIEKEIADKNGIHAGAK